MRDCKAFRKETEKITGYSIPLKIDDTKIPLAVPGHNIEKDAAAMVIAIDEAIDYWQKNYYKISNRSYGLCL